MRALKKTLLTAAMAAGLSYGASAQAVLVDLFNDPALNGVHFAQATDGGAAGVVDVVAAMQYPGGPVHSNSILGGYRDVIANLTYTDGSDVATARAAVGGGRFSFSSTSGDIGIGRIQWDGDDSTGNVADLNYTGLGGEDLITQPGCPVGGCNRFVATVLEADLGFVYSIGVYTDADNYTILSANTEFAISPSAFPGGVEAVYLFEWFLLPTGTEVEVELGFKVDILSVGTVDFTNIGALELVVNSNGKTTAVDLVLDSVMKTGEVPEPGVLALMGIGLLGATLAGRRRQGVKA